jgi:hypothetical protein
MEALQMLKFSVKKGRPSHFTAGMSKEEEIAQLEVEGGEGYCTRRSNKL